MQGTLAPSECTNRGDWGTETWPFFPLDELNVVQVFLVPFGISIVINNTDAYLCSLPQESCRKCHVVWKEHAGKTCEQVMERDEIRLRVAL